MKSIFLSLLMLASLHSPAQNKTKSKTIKKAENNLSYWVTDPQKNILFEKRTIETDYSSKGSQTININSDSTFQTIDGFGYTLSGGSSQHLSAMQPKKRKALLKEIFDTKDGIGVSYLRISIGASDLDENAFSYDDLPKGISGDFELKYFSVKNDLKTLIPILKEILSINPNIQILASPWSAPSWMKDNNSTIGGSLKKECFQVYAQYFVKYITALKNLGININAITIQNEPLNPANNPSMYMTSQQQSDFVKVALGPTFAKKNIKTKIIIYDHNALHPEYPIDILQNSDAAQYIDGSAFHLYEGEINAVGTVHDRFPNKNLYFTEQWVGAPGNIAEDLIWHTENVIIGSMRNWCKTALEWNLSSNPSLTPHTPGGCTQCLGAVTIDGNSVTRNSAYYIIAQASKLVRPGSVRIASNTLPNLPNVAFKRKDGKIVLIVLNKGKNSTRFNINLDGKNINSIINPGSVQSILL
ncbi:MAG: glucosylceramidase [Pseudopedobacter saltans]|uniref:Glucosylceramidase n=1 Tax=Pseudopedobacter saltans TaxID=151895 RepID=A0A2W5FF62_9SPHI|nr:MAG: glucosylceramidase [Pseudopedobacter saltans]